MAIIWQKHVGDKHYQVRKAGRSIRLYTDGVFHSQYNPDRPVTRGVWDLLMLPAFFYPPGAIKRVLVMGVGGGAVIHLLHRYIRPEQITAIDMDATHLTVAKQFFKIKRSMASLVEADAVKWLQTYKGPPFDMIVEDLFTEEGGEAARAVALTPAWFQLLNRHLGKSGMLVMNLFTAKELRNSAYCMDCPIAAQFKAVYSLCLPLFENIVVAFLKQQSSAKFLRREIARVDGLSAKAGPNQLQFQLRKITAD